MAWLVALLPFLAAALLAVLGRRGGDDPPRGPLALVGAFSMVAVAALAAFAGAREWTGAIAWSDTLGLTLDFGYRRAPISPVFATLVPTVAAAVIAYAAAREASRGLTRLLVMMAVFVGAMEIVAGAADLLTLLFGWELLGACSAVLIAHESRDAAKPRAAAAVFLTTRAGDLGLFLAVAAAFAGVGSLDYAAFGGLGAPWLQLVVLGVLVAAAAKSAQLPFAPWLFAAMEGPVPVSSLLHSATMVAAGAFLLIRLHPLLDAVAWFAPAAIAIGLVTALLGGVVALLQPHAKRLLAGSTSAQYGLMFVAVGAGYPGIAALHLVAHAFAKAPLFLATGAAHSCAGSYQLRRMRLGRALPGVAIASLFAAAAIGGVPPLGAAWTKEEIVGAGGHAVPWLAVLVAIGGGLSAAYMARFQLQAFGKGQASCDERTPRPVERGALYILAAVTVLLGLLWLPPMASFAGTALDSGLPDGKPWELVVSLALVAIGLAGGAAIARRRPALGEDGVAAKLADWLALRSLARIAIVRPARGLADALARVDDRIDRGITDTAIFAASIARALAGFDDAAVDRGVRASAAFAEWLARLGQRAGETAFDGAPEGLSRLVGEAGRQARRLQTGLTHHYYRTIVLVLAVALILLIVGG